MTQAEAGSRGPVLEEAARELEAAAHDARVAFDCLALGELDRAHTSALTARVAIDRGAGGPSGGQQGCRFLMAPGPARSPPGQARVCIRGERRYAHSARSVPGTTSGTAAQRSQPAMMES